MSTFYGQVEGQANTVASRRGSDRSGLRVSCQSYDGSIIVTTNESGVFSIEVSDTSRFYGETIWTGTAEQLRSILTGDKYYEQQVQEWLTDSIVA